MKNKMQNLDPTDPIGESSILNLESNPMVSTDSVGGLVERVKHSRKTVLTLVTVFGIFVAFSQVLAVDIDILQPASVIAYNEELVVNATGRFNSVYIGKQGTGGVTFFNGTIINSTTNSGLDNPVTFGDNVRVDGILFRTEEGGNNPLKIGDTLKPQTTASYDLGTADNQFRNAYFSGTVTVAALSGTGIINSASILDGTIATSDLADSAITTAKITDETIITGDIADNAVVSAKISDGTITGSDVNTLTNLNFNNLSLSGKATQARDQGGLAKALVYANDDGTCNRYFTFDNSDITCQKLALGIYQVTFSFEINDRYLQATPEATLFESLTLSYFFGGDNILMIQISDKDGIGHDTSFMLTIY